MVTRVQELFPNVTDSVDPVQRYRSDDRRSNGRRPWIVLNMITSIDGATTTDDHSGGLGSQADKEIFFALRSLSDVILVGAGTIQTENYGPPQLSDEAKTWRRSQGMMELPRIAGVSGRLSIDPRQKVFSDKSRRPWIITTATSDPARRSELSAVADVMIAGSDKIDFEDAFDQLSNAGAEVILCEGGPTLNAALFEANLVDEICWTVAPTITGGDARRLVHGARSEFALNMELVRVLKDGDFMFMRYVRS